MESFSLLRRVMPFLGLIIVAALIYDGGIFYSRWSANRQVRQAEADKVTSQERRELAAVGGDALKILSFYAAPGRIHSGAHTSLCYGVIGAKTVRMEPMVDSVWPALTRCVQVSPRKDTEYKLIAEDDTGHSATQSVSVAVR